MNHNISPNSTEKFTSTPVNDGNKPPSQSKPKEKSKKINNSFEIIKKQENENSKKSKVRNKECFIRQHKKSKNVKFVENLSREENDLIDGIQGIPIEKEIAKEKIVIDDESNRFKYSKKIYEFREKKDGSLELEQCLKIIEFLSLPCLIRTKKRKRHERSFMAVNSKGTQTHSGHSRYNRKIKIIGTTYSSEILTSPKSPNYQASSHFSNSSTSINQNFAQKRLKKNENIPSYITETESTSKTQGNELNNFLDTNQPENSAKETFKEREENKQSNYYSDQNYSNQERIQINYHSQDEIENLFPRFPLLELDPMQFQRQLIETRLLFLQAENFFLSSYFSSLYRPFISFENLRARNSKNEKTPSFYNYIIR